ncbi:uncharacterized protein TrAtP1_004051 [Trichoderma atroviride]|uniref:uncharacterized protein n=1 Tax=Hypocrea atroviridis TaxID=63577 RepID=UPI00331924A0|nr:hypothetical protein TrAtP1_004051 [Trichoderma atroviride]
MRLPYVADPPPVQTTEDAAIVQRIRERRAPRPLQALDLTLLHSPPGSRRLELIPRGRPHQDLSRRRRA